MLQSTRVELAFEYTSNLSICQDEYTPNSGEMVSDIPYPSFVLESWDVRLRLGVFFPFIFISWRLITLQYCSGFCHTLT